MSRPHLPQVSSRYGAPMGRRSSPSLDETARTVRLFHVPLDSGGYDSGGAYWGSPNNLYFAQDRDGDIQSVRASSRLHAAMLLNIDPRAFRVRLSVPAWWRDLPAVVEYFNDWNYTP